MSEAYCPISGSRSGSSTCPAGHGPRMGPRGCAFSGFQMSANTSYSPFNGNVSEGVLHARERKTLTELLLPEAPPVSLTKGMKNADSLNAPDKDVLAAALGAPARNVLLRAAEVGPKTGWKDGYLSSSYGFCPPDPSASPIALAMSPGRVWSDLCDRMPAVVARGKIREAILAIPLVLGAPEVIPDEALWAATVCLGILASVYRYEERNDGSEGIAFSTPPGAFKDVTGEADDEEEETKGIPRNIAIPLRQVCTRMGRPLPHLTQFDVSIYNYKIRDPTSVHPYLPRCENMDLRWPVFNDRGEAMFLLCMAEVHGCFIPGVELLARCQEKVMLRDNDGLLRDLIDLKALIDQLPYVFHKISVNANSGENFANPVEWGQRYAKFSAPLSKRVPALSGLALPMFLLLDAFLGRKNYDSFLGAEALHLRAWLPLNIRAFIAAIEYHYQIPDYVKESRDPRLVGVLEGIVESYAGERGFMGTHRYKVYGFLEVVAKTGRSETNGNAGATDSVGRPWEEVHRTLSDSMKERLEPFRNSLVKEPHEMRGTFEECRFKSRIINRTPIDQDPCRTTGMITFDLQNSGITFQPGDRLAVMPLNSWDEVSKISAALGLDEVLDTAIPLEQSSEWQLFAKHLASVSRQDVVPLTVKDILRRGHLAPLTKDLVMAFHMALRLSSSSILKVLASQEWPVYGSIGDLLQLAVTEVQPAIWDQAFDLVDLSWLPKLIPVEVPRTYSISTFSDDLLPSTVDLTVSRSEYKVSPLLRRPGSGSGHGVSSGFLNPDPSKESSVYFEDEELLIGLSRPLNFQLPLSATAPVAMFAGGSGVAPFRGFWQSRVRSGIGRNILFLGVQSRTRFVYEGELRELVRSGQVELHTAFSRDSNGLIYDPIARDLLEKKMKPRYIDTSIIEQGQTVCDLVMSKTQGGMGGYLYICGSVSVYETVMSGIRQAIYNNQSTTKESAETLLAAAFAERRLMLDIFMTPRPLSYNQPTISVTQLALHTGHRPNSRMWIGVHGAAYDITDFLPIHPGGTLIVAASAGLDATETFDALAHTNNAEVSSLLSKYFIGHLSSKPEVRSSEISELYDIWYQYLQTCVESLTTLSLEVEHIMADAKVWLSGGLLNMGGVRKFYQFQSRLMQNGFASLFGASITLFYPDEIYLKLSFAVVNSSSTMTKLPDVMGSMNRARSSPAALKAMKEISELGQFVCNGQSAQFHENGIINYAQAVTELDVSFLEQVRKEICTGLDGFDLVEAMGSNILEKQLLVKLCSFLMTIMERITQRLEMFYTSLSRYSLYQPEMEPNPARTRWKHLRRRIFDGSFFILAQDPQFTLGGDSKASRASRRITTNDDVDFFRVVFNAKAAVGDDLQEETNGHPISVPDNEPQRLAHRHTARAAHDVRGPSSYESYVNSDALNRMSTFIDKNGQAIRRLSVLPSDVSLADAFNRYASSQASQLHPEAPSISPLNIHRKSPSNSSRGQRSKIPIQIPQTHHPAL
ncbi:hypothetical protein AJ80_03344 [Polytolypa hystricis UAMH7299]|uniref:NADPH--hemoprotein reductase n=1 Tax=Polytolypa hystricis (strain UAMH7299) TaxID=1447883 RepID=A0A2B7YB56_POLH7|nr:hypothetical protein AJ80_03344 [Polytolypa hystricis UAMH7299]